MELNLREALIALLNSGDLKSPIVYLGETLSAQAAVEPDRGWDFSNVSLIGAPISKGVEALRAKLEAGGRRDLAELLPIYHIADFWRADKYNFGFTSGANKFSFENYTEYKLTKAQADSLVGALNGLDNRYFVLTLIGAGRNLTRMYRGEPDGAGFTATDKVYGNGQGRGLGTSDKLHLPGFGGENVPAHHYIYDIYFDAFTDENIVRYWTSWARAWGAAV